MSKEEKLLKEYITKKDEIKRVLEEKYKGNIYSPFNSGSYAKNTAINIKFDFDMVTPFKRNAFGARGTLEQMYNEVYDFLCEKYKDEASIRKQKVSIGLEFNSDRDGDSIKIDVVPGREYNQEQYKDDKNLNLYVYKQYGNFENGSDRIKTNIQAQIDNIKGKADKEKNSVRKIIRLLKVWKNNAKKDYPKSFFLELITIRAFEDEKIEGNVWETLRIVLEFIRDNVTKDNFALKDPGNSGNNLMDTLTNSEREQLSRDIKNMLERIDEDECFLEYYFPENPKFKNKEDDNKTKMPLPPPNLNFG
ncbi:nucleotidyltransferase family protein [Capnocytophaga cynodegmi]|uniref:nucleotidyltransferase n=1 Tax=Capnocytophaga cynodegmi TaxID=28189 RepID=UPI00385E920E